MTVEGQPSGGIIATTMRLAVTAIPPAFLVLCALNVLFLYGAIRFVEHQADARAALIGKILDNCLLKDLGRESRSQSESSQVTIPAARETPISGPTTTPGSAPARAGSS